jgi:hypothetical protein
MSKILAILAALGAVACTPPKFPDRATCQGIAIGSATASASALCPPSKGTWDECAHAQGIEDSLALALEACDVR